MGLESFVERVPDDGPERSLIVVADEASGVYGRMLERLVGDGSVDVDHVADGVGFDDGADDRVLLVEDDTVVAASPLRRVEEAALLTNSDAYRTGLTGFDADLPDVLAGLDDVPFELRGWPDAKKEKLLLIAVSRHIERLAHEGEGGRLRSSFQRLSRLRDERGTERVYRTVAGTPTDVHVYGRPDWVPTAEFGVVAHGGYTDDFERSWFVVYRPDGGGRAAALVAVEDEPRRWRGVWSYRESFIAVVEAYVSRNL
jgi:hypothetical protein